MGLPVMTDQCASSLDEAAISIVHALGGTWRGDTARCPCPAHQDQVRSLSVTIGNNAVVLRCLAGCGQEAVIGALPIALPLTSLGSFIEAARQVRVDETLMRAHAIWDKARPLAGTLGETYLRSHKIDFNPPELRFVWRCAARAGAKTTYHPAIIAAVRDHIGITAIDRIFLRSDGLARAKVDQNSVGIGQAGGGLGRWGPVPFDTLRLAEDCEEAASAMMIGTHGTPVWPVFGAARYAAIDIPPNIQRIIIYTRSGKAADDAVARAKRHLTSGNRALEVEYAPDGLSWNDSLQQLCR